MSADAVFTVGSVLFIVALVPAFLDRTGDKSPPAFTGLLTGSVLAAFALTYLSLGLTFSWASSACLASMWLTIGTRELLRGRRPRPEPEDPFGLEEPDMLEEPEGRRPGRAAAVLPLRVTHGYRGFGPGDLGPVPPGLFICLNCGKRLPGPASRGAIRDHMGARRAERLREVRELATTG